MNTLNNCLIDFILEVEEILVQLVCDICVSFTTALLLLYYCFTTALLLLYYCFRESLPPSKP
jgi:hypothetical protein